MINGKKRSTPLDMGTKLRCDEGTQLSDLHLYRVLVGSLIYLTITRPDIAFSVGVVNRYMQTPRKPNFEGAKNILKYVNSTLDVGLFYRKGAKFSLEGFVDADFGGDLDDRRSTSGFVFLCGKTSISWCSKKQSSVSLSTTEAEYKASAHAAQECVWLRRLIEDLQECIDELVPIHGDNLSAIKLTSNPVFHARTNILNLSVTSSVKKCLMGLLIWLLFEIRPGRRMTNTKLCNSDAFMIQLNGTLGPVLISARLICRSHRHSDSIPAREVYKVLLSCQHHLVIRAVRSWTTRKTQDNNDTSNATDTGHIEDSRGYSRSSRFLLRSCHTELNPSTTKLTGCCSPASAVH
ncbi:hypothetical protein MLD38_031147 [Melastoma candidum]|uniref:Uncharacterized protein n=1 Tax=Melastoma candidum TaxID=119954 RepID=A0ACB9MNF3_9MYRT|nr:hypothetical protein MLD38_031147 [Melastoma candidum]